MSSANELKERRCKPCEGGVDALDRHRSEALISQVNGWTLSDDAKSIHRRYEFKNFHNTMAFVNALAWIAHREDHHPDFKAGYNYCDVTFTTHAVNGLSENDFICAAKINALQEE